MTTEIDIVNRALQTIGTRTTIASLNENSNEAIQAKLIIDKLRDDLLRMAPWSCATHTMNLTYITSAPGTPENPTIGTTTWQRGQPPPPWAYMYQYPSECIKALWIIPQFTTGFASGVPITTAVTGGSPSFWNGPPVRFKIATEKFFSPNACSAGGGTGYVVGDLITLAAPSVGAPAQIVVTGTGPGGAVTAAEIIPVIGDSFGNQAGGSYFTKPTNPISQGSTSGAGTGVIVNLLFPPQADFLPNSTQRVILTNQEAAILCYVRQIDDPNVFDPLFQDAWVAILGARLTYALTGDKQLANLKIAETNQMVMEARKADGNEGLTINDVTPDFIRTRGIYYSDWEYSPNVQYDWGALFTPY